MSPERLTASDAKHMTVGRTGQSLTVADLKVEDFVRYAGASGDFNPLHYDQSYAKESGHPDAFAQGMLVAGIASRFVTDWIGIDALQSFRTRFAAQVWPGDTLTVDGAAADRTVEDSVTLELEIVVRNQDGSVVLTGDATAMFPNDEGEETPS
jgi:peroxisomal enoyl-CoA hydratase 2